MVDGFQGIGISKGVSHIMGKAWLMGKRMLAFSRPNTYTFTFEGKFIQSIARGGVRTRLKQSYIDLITAAKRIVPSRRSGMRDPHLACCGGPKYMNTKERKVGQGKYNAMTSYIFGASSLWSF